MKYDKARVQLLLQRHLCEDTLNELISLNYGLMYKQLKRFHLLNDQDALSLSYEALFKAINTFDASKNFQFSTYGTVCIYNALGSYVRSIKNTPDLTYYEATTDNGYSLLETLESEDKSDKPTLVRNGVDNIRIAVSASLLETTNPLHRAIVEAWTMSDFTLTHVKIADQEGCSQSYVSQVIKRFKRSIKNKLEEIESA